MNEEKDKTNELNRSSDRAIHGWNMGNRYRSVWLGDTGFIWFQDVSRRSFRHANGFNTIPSWYNDVLACVHNTGNATY